MQSVECRVLVRVDDRSSEDDRIAYAVLAPTPQRAQQLAQMIGQARELFRDDLRFHHVAVWDDSLEWHRSRPDDRLREACTLKPIAEALESGYVLLDDAAFDGGAPQRMECATLHIYPDSLFWDAIPRDCDKHVQTYSVPHELIWAFARGDGLELRRRLREIVA